MNETYRYHLAIRSYCTAAFVDVIWLLGIPVLQPLLMPSDYQEVFLYCSLC